MTENLIIFNTRVVTPLGFSARCGKEMEQLSIIDNATVEVLLPVPHALLAVALQDDGLHQRAGKGKRVRIGHNSFHHEKTGAGHNV